MSAIPKRTVRDKEIETMCEKYRRESSNEVSYEIQVKLSWGQGETYVLHFTDHVHVNGDCVKNRFGNLCGSADGTVTSQESTEEKVHHPRHYNLHPSGVECVDIIEHMTHNIGAAMKYLWRHGLKDGSSADEDLRKAIWWIERERVRLSKLAIKEELHEPANRVDAVSNPVDAVSNSVDAVSNSVNFAGGK